MISDLQMYVRIIEIDSTRKPYYSIDSSKPIFNTSANS